MKQAILNSVIGRVAFAARAKISLLLSALLQPDSVGMMANDQLSTQLITRLCLPNKTFVDVGAHIGSVISEVHAEDKSVDIVAIEAIPGKVANLKRKFPYAQIHPCAVGESEGNVSFFIDLAQSGYSSIFRPTGRDKRLEEITVPMRKLDDIVPSGNVDAIKIDVEGAELGVLRGAGNLLSEDRPTIMLESGPTHTNIPGYSKDALWKYLTERDYFILVPNRVAHNDDGLTFEGFVDSHTWPRRTTNYFAVPKERRREIRDRVRLILGINTGQQKPVGEATKPTEAATSRGAMNNAGYPNMPHFPWLWHEEYEEYEE